MIKLLEHGDLLKADVTALVNTVNTVGIMGKGIALQFKRMYPENFDAYSHACRVGEVRIGKVFVHPLQSIHNPRFIINFPTKKHWRAKSRLADIKRGLGDLNSVIRALGIRSIAVPPLGCGNGGLDWREVYPLIRSELSDLADVDVYLYAPTQSRDDLGAAPISAKPPMTAGRAAIVRLLGQYLELGFSASVLEIQKLAYFLQEAGQPLRLAYVKHKFGPFAPNLAHVLNHIEGHYVVGFGDGSRGRTAQLRLVSGSQEAAARVLNNHPDVEARFERVKKLIDGYETPYGMELLATVHWVVNEDMAAGIDSDAAVHAVHAWSSHKKVTFLPPHIIKAWSRLHEQGWIRN